MRHENEWYRTWSVWDLQRTQTHSSRMLFMSSVKNFFLPSMSNCRDAWNTHTKIFNISPHVRVWRSALPIAYACLQSCEAVQAALCVWETSASPNSWPFFLPLSLTASLLSSSSSSFLSDSICTLSLSLSSHSPLNTSHFIYSLLHHLSILLLLEAQNSSVFFLPFTQTHLRSVI